MRKYDAEYKQAAVKKIHGGQSQDSRRTRDGRRQELAAQLEAADGRGKFRCRQRSAGFAQAHPWLEMEREILRRAALILGRVLRSSLINT